MSNIFARHCVVLPKVASMKMFRFASAPGAVRFKIRCSGSFRYLWNSSANFLQPDFPTWCKWLGESIIIVTIHPAVIVIAFACHFWQSFIARYTLEKLRLQKLRVAAGVLRPKLCGLTALKCIFRSHLKGINEGVSSTKNSNESLLHRYPFPVIQRNVWVGHAYQENHFTCLDAAICLGYVIALEFALRNRWDSVREAELALEFNQFLLWLRTVQFYRGGKEKFANQKVAHCIHERFNSMTAYLYTSNRSHTYTSLTV